MTSKRTTVIVKKPKITERKKVSIPFRCTSCYKGFKKTRVKNYIVDNKKILLCDTCWAELIYVALPIFNSYSVHILGIVFKFDKCSEDHIEYRYEDLIGEDLYYKLKMICDEDTHKSIKISCVVLVNDSKNNNMSLVEREFEKESPNLEVFFETVTDNKCRIQMVSTDTFMDEYGTLLYNTADYDPQNNCEWFIPREFNELEQIAKEKLILTLA